MWRAARASAADARPRLRGLLAGATVSLDRKRWAQRAHELQFSQLAAIQARAEQWRNGLVSLTALFAVVTIVKGPDTASKLSREVLHDVVSISSWAFSLLVVGALLTMFAAYGVPGRRQLLTGEALEQWERAQAGRARLAMLGGAIFSVTGLLLVGIATRDVILDSGRNSPLVEVHLPGNETTCGRLIGSSNESLTIEIEPTSTTVVPLKTVTRLRVPDRCQTMKG